MANKQRPDSLKWRQQSECLAIKESLKNPSQKPNALIKCLWCQLYWPCIIHRYMYIYLYIIIQKDSQLARLISGCGPFNELCNQRAGEKVFQYIFMEYLFLAP